MPTHRTAPWLVSFVGLTSLLSLGLLGGCAGSSDVVRPKPLCEMAFGNGTKDLIPATARDWLKLVVQTQVTNEGYVAEYTCMGEPIEPQPPPLNCQVQSGYIGTPKPVPLVESSVIESRLSGGRSIVWIVTHRYPNGDGFGPIAITRNEGNRLVVGVLGQMRLRTTRVELSVWDIQGRSVLVGQGESCRDEAKPDSCKRAANILVYTAQHLLTVPISDPQGQCIDEPWVELHMETDKDLENGWNRHFEINTTVGHDDRYVVLTEGVKVDDSDPNNPDVPSRTVREVNTERFLHVEGPRLVSKQQPLWPKILPANGKIKLTRELE
jgi:hypothetical protein